MKNAQNHKQRTTSGDRNMAAVMVELHRGKVKKLPVSGAFSTISIYLIIFEQLSYLSSRLMQT